MKVKIYIMISLSLLIWGCQSQNNSMFKFENKQQADFDSFLKNKSEQTLPYYNDIQKKEFNEKFGKDLTVYLDSVKLFVNWKANIQYIKTYTRGRYTEISFNLYYKPSKYREVSFSCSHFVKTDSLPNDYLYNQVKNISDYSIVYFDGFIIRDINNNVVYENNNDDLRIDYPNYRFNVLTITTSNKHDTLSSALRNTIDIDFKVFALLKQKINKNISEKEWKKRMHLLPVSKMQSKLTPYEKQYSLRLRQYLVDDLSI